MILDPQRATGKNEEMNREQAIATLRGYEPELKAIGVVSASLFGQSRVMTRGSIPMSMWS